MRSIISQFSHMTLVIIMTVSAAILSVALVTTIYKIADQDLRPLEIITGAIVPSIVAPSLTWYVLKLLLKLDTLEKHMRNLATYDLLTNALTRGAFIDTAVKHLNMANRNKNTFALLMLDLDHFKAINDKYGHAKGDEVLRIFGSIANQHKRTSDIIGRFGGEEFVFLLPDTDMNGAVCFSEMLHSKIRNNYVRQDGQRIRFTASIGVAIFYPNAGIHNIDDLIRQSDEALYAAKRKGKNCTVLFQSDTLN
ncbi:MAG: GGDEF domain-containing protein [Candidatus Brocadiaceae bacterium]|nr:GGDEF domain-containing protein [Candidatus Brocadiaceae bacterium]